MIAQFTATLDNDDNDVEELGAAGDNRALAGATDSGSVQPWGNPIAVLTPPLGAISPKNRLLHISTHQQQLVPFQDQLREEDRISCETSM